jgi:hypothetical protein
MGAQRPSSAWRVVAVGPQDSYKIQVRFADGLEGVVDMSVLIFSERAGVFAALKDETLFKSVLVEQGAVAWPNGLDLAPDAMHRAIRATGTFIPGMEQAA